MISARSTAYPVLDVIDEDERIVHVLESPLRAADVDCTIDSTRRRDHMQQHTGQHLLSAVLADLYGMQTVSFHMGAASSTIDLATPTLTPEQIEAAEARANAVVQENRPVRTDIRRCRDRCRPSEAHGANGTHPCGDDRLA